MKISTFKKEEKVLKILFIKKIIHILFLSRLFFIIGISISQKTKIDRKTLNDIYSFVLQHLCMNGHLKKSFKSIL